MDLQIRLATNRDIPALETLIRESVKALSVEYYSQQQILSGLSHVFGVDTQLVIDRTYFIAEVENQIAGSGGWSKRKTLFGADHSKSDKTDPLLDPARDAARIRAFYVNPEFSRRGVATGILATCEHAARIAGFARVELAATLPGVPFYLARGYEKLEAMFLQTPDGESLPAFRMTRTL
jgi:N-acetylglutamate synthase-like GNAT family acetyltransferase